MIVGVVPYPLPLVDDHTLFNVDSSELSDSLFTSQAIGPDSSNILDNSLISYEDYITDVNANLGATPNDSVTEDFSNDDLGLQNDNSINVIPDPLDPVLLADQSGSSCGSVSRKRDDVQLRKLRQSSTSSLRASTSTSAELNY